MEGKRILCRSILVSLVILAIAAPAFCGTAAEIKRDAEVAWEKRYDRSPQAKGLSARTKGILVFASIFKGGSIVGGHYGEGALFQNGQCRGYDNSVAAFYGLQVGAQTFGFAMFMMTDDALTYLARAEGFEFGLGPSIVVVDKGTARSMTTTTAKDDIQAFFFDQEGLMAGMGLQGAKISAINPD